ncbi:MAG: C4-dicarboxylate TRAP transporter substrate-binding protein [Planctomycetaceae bacterium]|nr:C4-dicarboxylate TRAP transporter substrate-binding protein [Planctomycetaceae bacterium]
MKASFSRFVLLFAALLWTGAAVAAADVTIQIGYENHPGEPLDLGCQEWKRLVEEESNGTMTIELYPSSQLGSKNDIIDQMLAGDSVITLADGAFYADRGVPDFNILFAPYLFTTWDDCWTLIKSDWYKKQSDKLVQRGLKILTSNWVYGDRHTLTTKPVRTVADIAGMKICVPNNAIQIAGFEVLGASPTPLPLGDVYTSLQQGVIDGLENPIPVLYNGKFQEVAKYLTLDGHVKNFTTFVCGTLFFDSLTPDQQRILMECGDKAGLFNNDIVFKATEELTQKFRDEGVEVIEVDVEEFKAKAMPLYSDPAVTAKWTPGLYDIAPKAMGK